jgi:hypothetical protein
VNLGYELPAAFSTATAQDPAAPLSCHARAKPMSARAAYFAWLIGALHGPQAPEKAGKAKPSGSRVSTQYLSRAGRDSPRPACRRTLQVGAAPPVPITAESEAGDSTDPAAPESGHPVSVVSARKPSADRDYGNACQWTHPLKRGLRPLQLLGRAPRERHGHAQRRRHGTRHDDGDDHPVTKIWA